MAQFRAWTIIIIFCCLILYFFRHTIKRLIFFLILLGIAYFIFGIFSPTGADKVRYYIQNIPNGIASFFGGDAFVTYDEYQETDEYKSTHKEKEPREREELTEKKEEKEEKSDDDEVFTGKLLSYHFQNANLYLSQRIPATVHSPIQNN